MKRKWMIFLVAIVMVAALAFAAACSDLGNNQTDGSIESAADTTTITESDLAAASEEVQNTLSAVSATDYYESELVVVAEEQQVTDAVEQAVAIDLSTLGESELPSSVKYSNNVLTIKEAGTYILSGTLNGSVQVDKGIEGTVRIVLNGATIKTLDSQASAAIVFKQSDALRILTVAEGTVNEVSDSVGDTAADGDGAAIQAKKSSLTINGSGTLIVMAVGEEANGIKVKNTLTILSADIQVTAVKNGIKADNLIEIKEATLTVTAGNDGIKTDIEPETEEEALAYAADPTAGYIYIENSTITVTAADDGIAANACLYINNRTEDVITVTTHGGAPATVTERSSDEADGKALKAGGIVLEDEEGNETLYPATFETNYAIVITGGTFVLNSNDDAIHSKGILLIAGGTFTIASGDDGLHAEYLTKITGGNITVTKGYEGIEGGAVEITGGTITLNATDDGVNAANADLTNYTYYLLITGGDLTVDCSGDGLDSNGKLLISGGNIKVFGPVNGGNSALDSETGTTISGGSVIATCREAMDPVGATQYMVTANVSVSAGTTVSLKDPSGNVVITFTAPKSCQNIVISTPELKAGNYTLVYGNNSVSVTAKTGTNGGMGGFGGGQMPGGGQATGGRPGGRASFSAEGDMIGGDNSLAAPDGNMPSSDGQTPPALPNGEMPEWDGQTPPAIPNGEPPAQGQEPPAFPNGEMPNANGQNPPPFSNGQDGFDGMPIPPQDGQYGRRMMPPFTPGQGEPNATFGAQNASLQ